jgi:hypothetical protein
VCLLVPDFQTMSKIPSLSSGLKPPTVQTSQLYAKRRGPEVPNATVDKRQRVEQAPGKIMKTFYSLVF